MNIAMSNQTKQTLILTNIKALYKKQKKIFLHCMSTLFIISKKYLYLVCKSFVSEFKKHLYLALQSIN